MPNFACIDEGDDSGDERNAPLPSLVEERDVMIVSAELQESLCCGRYKQALLDMATPQTIADARRKFDALVHDDFVHRRAEEEPNGMMSQVLLLSLKKLAGIDESNGRWEDAMRWLAMATQRESRDVAMWHRLGMLAISQKRWNVARCALEAALENDPQFAPSLKSLVQVVYELGDFEACKQLVQKAIIRKTGEGGGENDGGGGGGEEDDDDMAFYLVILQSIKKKTRRTLGGGGGDVAMVDEEKGEGEEEEGGEEQRISPKQVDIEIAEEALNPELMQGNEHSSLLLNCAFRDGWFQLGKSLLSIHSKNSTGKDSLNSFSAPIHVNLKPSESASESAKALMEKTLRIRFKEEEAMRKALEQQQAAAAAAAAAAAEKEESSASSSNKKTTNKLGLKTKTKPISSQKSAPKTPKTPTTPDGSGKRKRGRPPKNPSGIFLSPSLQQQQQQNNEDEEQQQQSQQSQRNQEEDDGEEKKKGEDGAGKEQVAVDVKMEENSNKDEDGNADDKQNEKEKENDEENNEGEGEEEEEEEEQAPRQQRLFRQAATRISSRQAGLLGLTAEDMPSQHHQQQQQQQQSQNPQQQRLRSAYSDTEKAAIVLSRFVSSAVRGTIGDVEDAEDAAASGGAGGASGSTAVYQKAEFYREEAQWPDFLDFVAKYASERTNCGVAHVLHRWLQVVSKVALSGTVEKEFSDLILSVFDAIGWISENTQETVLCIAELFLDRLGLGGCVNNNNNNNNNLAASSKTGAAAAATPGPLSGALSKAQLSKLWRHSHLARPILLARICHLPLVKPLLLSSAMQAGSQEGGEGGAAAVARATTLDDDDIAAAAHSSSSSAMDGIIDLSATDDADASTPSPSFDHSWTKRVLWLQARMATASGEKETSMELLQQCLALIKQLPEPKNISLPSCSPECSVNLTQLEAAIRNFELLAAFKASDGTASQDHVMIKTVLDFFKNGTASAVDPKLLKDALEAAERVGDLKSALVILSKRLKTAIEQTTTIERIDLVFAALSRVVMVLQQQNDGKEDAATTDIIPKNLSNMVAKGLYTLIRRSPVLGQNLDIAIDTLYRLLCAQKVFLQIPSTLTSWDDEKELANTLEVRFFTRVFELIEQKEDSVSTGIIAYMGADLTALSPAAQAAATSAGVTAPSERSWRRFRLLDAQRRALVLYIQHRMEMKRIAAAAAAGEESTDRNNNSNKRHRHHHHENGEVEGEKDGGFFATGATAAAATDLMADDTRGGDDVNADDNDDADFIKPKESRRDSLLRELHERNVESEEAERAARSQPSQPSQEQRENANKDDSGSSSSSSGTSSSGSEEDDLESDQEDGEEEGGEEEGEEDEEAQDGDEMLDVTSSSTRKRQQQQQQRLTLTPHRRSNGRSIRWARATRKISLISAFDFLFECYDRMYPTAPFTGLNDVTGSANIGPGVILMEEAAAKDLIVLCFKHLAEAAACGKRDEYVRRIVRSANALGPHLVRFCEQSNGELARKLVDAYFEKPAYPAKSDESDPCTPEEYAFASQLAGTETYPVSARLIEYCVDFAFGRIQKKAPLTNATEDSDPVSGRKRRHEEEEGEEEEGNGNNNNNAMETEEGTASSTSYSLSSPPPALPTGKAARKAVMASAIPESLALWAIADDKDRMRMKFSSDLFWRTLKTGFVLPNAWKGLGITLIRPYDQKMPTAAAKGYALKALAVAHILEPRDSMVSFTLGVLLYELAKRSTPEDNRGGGGGGVPTPVPANSASRSSSNNNNGNAAAAAASAKNTESANKERRSPLYAASFEMFSRASKWPDRLEGDAKWQAFCFLGKLGLKLKHSADSILKNFAEGLVQCDQKKASTPLYLLHLARAKMVRKDPNVDTKLLLTYSTTQCLNMANLRRRSTRLVWLQNNAALATAVAVRPELYPQTRPAAAAAAPVVPTTTSIVPSLPPLFDPLVGAMPGMQYLLHPLISATFGLDFSNAVTAALIPPLPTSPIAVADPTPSHHHYLSSSSSPHETAQAVLSDALQGLYDAHHLNKEGTQPLLKLAQIAYDCKLLTPKSAGELVRPLFPYAASKTAPGEKRSMKCVAKDLFYDEGGFAGPLLLGGLGRPKVIHFLAEMLLLQQDVMTLSDLCVVARNLEVTYLEAFVEEATCNILFLKIRTIRLECNGDELAEVAESYLRIACDILFNSRAKSLNASSLELRIVEMWRLAKSAEADALDRQIEQTYTEESLRHKMLMENIKNWFRRTVKKQRAVRPATFGQNQASGARSQSGASVASSAAPAPASNSSRRRSRPPSTPALETTSNNNNNNGADDEEMNNGEEAGETTTLTATTVAAAATGEEEQEEENEENENEEEAVKAERS